VAVVIEDASLANEAVTAMRRLFDLAIRADFDVGLVVGSPQKAQECLV
jgi:hypothetical protein